MKRSNSRVLQVKGGLIGPKTPRDQATPGLIDAQNVMLTPNAGAIVPVPGYRRTYPYHMLATATTIAGGTVVPGTLGVAYRILASATNEIAYCYGDPGAGYALARPGWRVVTVPPQAFLQSDGLGIAVVDEATGRVDALGWHRGGLTQDPATDPYPIVRARLMKAGPDDKANVLCLQDKTLIVVGGDVAYVWDGGEMRPAGLPAPAFPPLFTANNAVIPGTVGDFPLAIKYIGTGFTKSGFYYDRIHNSITFYSNVDTLTQDGSPWIIGNNPSVTYGGLVGTINGWASGAWVAYHGTAINDSDTLWALATSLEVVQPTDVTSLAVATRAGAQLLLHTPVDGVGIRLRQTAGAVNARYEIISDGSAPILKLWDNNTTGYGSPTHQILLTGSPGPTYQSLEDQINAFPNWAARVESAVRSSAVIGASQNPLHVAWDSATSVGVSGMQGSTVLLDTGVPVAQFSYTITSGLDPAGTGCGIFGVPFTVTFAGLSGGAGRTRTMDYGDGNPLDQVSSWSADPTATPPTAFPATWTHTYTDGTTYTSRNGDQFIFHATMTDTDGSGLSSTTATSPDIIGKYQSYDVQIEPPGTYAFTSAVLGWSNGQHIPVSATNSSGAWGAHWGETISYRDPGSSPTPPYFSGGNATQDYYPDMKVFVRQQVRSAGRFASFALHNPCSIGGLPSGVAWKASVALNLLWWNRITTPAGTMVFKKNTNVSASDLEFVNEGGGDGLIIPPEKANLIIKLFSASGEEIGSIAGTTGYLVQGENDLTLHGSALTGAVVVKYVTLEFAGPPVSWQMSAGVARPMLVQVNSLSIYDYRHSASGETT